MYNQCSFIWIPGIVGDQIVNSRAPRWYLVLVHLNSDNSTGVTVNYVFSANWIGIVSQVQK